MLTGPQTWAVVGIASLIWAALVVVAGLAGNWNQVSSISTIVPFLLLGAAAFERWIWRWSRLHPHLVRTPVLHGTWKGELRSLWKPSRGKPAPVPKTVYLVVEQTLTTVFVRLYSDESESEQVAGTVTRGRSHQLVSAYVNTPRIGHRAASPIHHGGLLLKVVDGQAPCLEGEYWTDRGSTGAVKFTERASALAHSYEEAERLAYAPARVS